MIVITLPRGMGKTTQLIKYSADTGCYLVVIDHTAAIEAVHMAKEIGLDIPFPITFDEFLQYRALGKNIPGLLIDNAEILLMRLIDQRIPIKAITVSPSLISLD